MYETGEFGVFVDEMSQLMSYDEAQFIFCHQVEKGGVDIHNVRLAFVLCRHGESVDRRVSRDIEVNRFIEMQLVFYLMAKSIEIGQQVFLYFQTMSLHAASPVGVGTRCLYFFEHGLYHTSLEGIVDLFAELFFECNGGLEVPPSFRVSLLGFRCFHSVIVFFPKIVDINAKI